jgi:hypothetical protein
MALFRGFDRFLLFCRVQKAEHTVNILLCRVPRSSTQQTLTFAVCLTPAHGKGDDVHGPLGSVNRAMTSPCAAPRHTPNKKVRRVLGCGHMANADGVELQRTAVNVEPISPWAVWWAHGEVLIRRVSGLVHTAKSRFAVCFLFAVCLVLGARQKFCSPCARGKAHGKHWGTRRTRGFR